ncbi:MAG: type II toxin-antitoxin system MqsR family toxin [Flavobacteriales bacterium]|nr:type II toxin-antitoxin system MqsR family toxin [Flavobacteriales bacterium]
MPTPDEVEAFLREFHARMKVWDVVFRDDRAKNVEALVVLGIVPKARERMLAELSVSDFSEGPMKDSLNSGPDLWVFGKELKEHEVYIKVTLGMQKQGPVFCISFHPSEHTMTFPFKSANP